MTLKGTYHCCIQLPNGQQIHVYVQDQTVHGVSRGCKRTSMDILQLTVIIAGQFAYASSCRIYISSFERCRCFSLKLK